MVATELAQQILEDVWSDGQPLDEKRPEIAKLWKQMQRDDGKVRAHRAPCARSFAAALSLA